MRRITERRATKARFLRHESVRRACARRSGSHCAGFSLLELAIVIAVIGTLVAATTGSFNIIRQTTAQRIYTDFVMGWQDSFTSFVTQTKMVPADNAQTPTGFVRSAMAMPLCNTSASPALSDTFLAHGIALPQGAGPGREDRLVYQDGNGSPHELRVCIATMNWSVPGTATGLYVLAPRHVLVMNGLTVELARQLDVLTDGKADARFGRLRSASASTLVSTGSVAWPGNPAPENNIPEILSYLELQ